MFMKSESCRCYPWYIYERFLSVYGGGKNTDLDDYLKDYWENDILAEKQINFDSKLNGYKYSS